MLFSLQSPYYIEVRHKFSLEVFNDDTPSKLRRVSNLWIASSISDEDTDMPAFTVRSFPGPEGYVVFTCQVQPDITTSPTSIAKSHIERSSTSDVEARSSCREI